MASEEVRMQQIFMDLQMSDKVSLILLTEMQKLLSSSNMDEVLVPELCLRGYREAHNQLLQA